VIEKGRDVGALSERLTIQSATETADGQGGAAVAGTTVATVWAELIPQRASERIQAQAVGSTANYRFRVRTRTDLAPSMRVVWAPRGAAAHAAQTLEIAGITYEPDRTFLVLECGVVS